MTATVFPCYALQDADTAIALAIFLEDGAGVRVFLEEGVMQPGEDLASKARDARAADMVLVLFSRHSVPVRWPRPAWEDALIHEPAAEGVRIAFARCDDCRPPQVLQPRFELGGASRQGMRGLKRWVRGHYGTQESSQEHGPELESLGVAIADCPGAAQAASPELAVKFVQAFREDYDEVLTLECAGRSLTALAGDLGARLGLRLEGDLESNLARLREFCCARRFLLVLSGGSVHSEALTFGGRCSTLIAPGPVTTAPEDDLRHVQRAFAQLDPAAGWEELCALARLGRRLTQGQGRIAECDELMRQWHAAAQARGDRAVLDESAREMVWILESWGRAEEARRLEYRRATEFGEQMMLPFGN